MEDKEKDLHFQQFISTISELCNKRAKVYPTRNEILDDLKKEIKKLSIYLFENYEFDSFIPDEVILNCIENFKNDPIFICGAERSGKTLISQLLDGHPNIFVLPASFNYFYRVSGGKGDLFDFFNYYTEKIITPIGKPPFWFIGKEKATFQELLGYLTFFYEKYKKNPFLTAVFSTFAANPKKSLETRFWVEKTAGSEFHVRTLLKQFPKAKFIHMFRNPLSNIAEKKKLYSMRNREFPPVVISNQIKKSINMGLCNLKEYGREIYLGLKYEDLITNTEKTMKSVCNFLKIEFNEILCIPTENLRPTISNSYYADLREQGIVRNPSMSNKWVTELTKNEKKVMISLLFKPAMRMGYRDWEKKHIKKYKIFYYDFLFNNLYAKIILIPIFSRYVVFLNFLSDTFTARASVCDPR